METAGRAGRGFTPLWQVLTFYSPNSRNRHSPTTPEVFHHLWTLCGREEIIYTNSEETQLLYCPPPSMLGMQSIRED